MNEQNAGESGGKNATAAFFTCRFGRRRFGRRGFGRLFNGLGRGLRLRSGRLFGFKRSESLVVGVDVEARAKILFVVYNNVL